ncbi:LysM peptidoglycan-binding domain-containing protein [Bizionia argentinensis JUB59]|uniref:LysM peptidoglycan-binding domain-containing protein n=1 Tax=Bizionia argentinensis JUB59 TaxID=1046627 RepID=G2EEA7_9FLAO|nr:lytic transglycosylase domain-containing protein [Bizionia argentinensis]EGV43141.1 LysM peptidoglycan-binding domain-containing protein [Bizionia argentinensis JUB59]
MFHLTTKNFISLFTLFFAVGILYAQDSIPKKIVKKHISEEQLIAGESYDLDTIVDGQQFYKRQINIDPESLDIKSLIDLEFTSELEQKWREELYSTGLYDTLYSTISKLDYKEIYYPELPTDTLKIRLERLNAKTPFNIAYNPSLESVIKMFLKNRRVHFERLMGLSNFYFPMFERELDAQDVPLEIKYLAIVESALKPRARSHAGATGLWQFMFATGKEYGLDVSSYVDERSDPIKSTKAAAKYLSALYRMFGDWDLALAAYNSGPGNVLKAIRRSGGYENYWNIRHNLPRETAGYLPAFLATMYIMEYAEEHGLVSEKPVFHHFETDTIHVKQMLTLDQVSEATGVNMEELQFLNPAYKLDIIPFVANKNYTLRLPVSAIGTFVNNESTIYTAAKTEFDKKEKPLPQFFESESKTRYKVKSGDYLGLIARKYGVRVSQIKQWNGLRSNNLRVGQRLTIYPRNPGASSSSSSTSSTSASAPKSYMVKSGDSLWSIAKKFSGVSVQNIRDWNGISGTNLKPGMILKLSKG